MSSSFTSSSTSSGYLEGSDAVSQWGDGLAPNHDEIFDVFTPSQLEDVRCTIATDGQFSSDGEFTAIANKEMAELGESPLNLDAIKVEAPVTDLVAFNSATARDPSIQNWGGELSFRVRVQPPLKSKDAQFSAKLNKLYINQNRAVQIWFNVRPDESVQLPTSGLCIRAVTIYTRPDDFLQPVAVCHNHSRNSLGCMKSPYSEHLVRCTSEDSSHYSTDPSSNRHSVLTALPVLQAGSNEVSLGYKFMDLGSCTGGLNRRDTAVIFTMEFSGNIIGRQVLPVRICTCPKRDMETDEKHEKKNITTINDLNPGVGKVKVENEEFWVLARGRTNYEALKKVGEILECSRRGSNVTEYSDAVNRFNGLERPYKRKRNEEEPNDVPSQLDRQDSG